MHGSEIHSTLAILVDGFDHITDQSVFGRVMNKGILLCKGVCTSKNESKNEDDPFDILSLIIVCRQQNLD